jgi:hypothetical protein
METAELGVINRYGIQTTIKSARGSNFAAVRTVIALADECYTDTVRECRESVAKTPAPTPLRQL